MSEHAGQADSTNLQAANERAVDPIERMCDVLLGLTAIMVLVFVLMYGLPA